MAERTESGTGHALILVVERNPAVQRLERYLLENAGFEVEFASDGISALALARELRPHLLVSEVLVPRLDGFSLCRAIRIDRQSNSVAIILISHLEAAKRALEAGADAFLLKPFDPDVLIEKVSLLLREKGLTNG
ncbi:MAG: response regulator [Thermoanaerobaculia bacterium]